MPIRQGFEVSRAVVDNPAWTMQQRVDAIETAGGVAYVCFQDVARTSFNDYYAMRLD